MSMINILKNIGSTSRQIGSDTFKTGKKIKDAVKSSKKAYTYADYVEDGGGFDEAVKLLHGYSLPMTSKIGVIGIGGYGALQLGKSGISMKNNSATGSVIESNVPYNRISQDFRKPKIDDLGATGGMVFNMHNKR